jgi:hypothetical protein
LNLGNGTLSALALTSLVVALLSLAVALSLGRRLRQVRRSYSWRRRASGAEDAVAPATNGTPRAFEGELAELRDAVVRSIRNVGIVRFDAFEDLGGRLSFAVALLDEEGSGVVLSSINGRQETRIYAKPIERGESRINLSEEESESIRRALSEARA